jgi:hypothetical protein
MLTDVSFAATSKFDRPSFWDGLSYGIKYYEVT